MTTFVSILDTQLDPDAPLTSSLAYAWRDNPVAIVEGASGAPKIADKTALVTLTGSTTTINSIGAWSGLWIDAKLSIPTAGSAGYDISFSDDGSIFYGATSICTSVLSYYGHQITFIDFASGTYKAVLGYNLSGDKVVTTSAAISGLTNSVVSIRFTSTGSVPSAGGGAILRLQGGESSS